MLSGAEIKNLRKNKKLTQEELSKLLGVSRSAIYDWERGKYFPEGQNLVKLAGVFGVSVGYLMGEENTDTDQAILTNRSISPDTIHVPLLSKSASVCAGNGDNLEYADADIERYIKINKELVGIVSLDQDKRPYFVWVSGDSMNDAGIVDGSMALINPAEEVYDGDPALVCYGENQVQAIKWVYYSKDGGREVRSADSITYKPKVFDAEEVELGYCRILGRVMGTWGIPKRG